MRKILIWILLTVVFYKLEAQTNLVPNPSFEFYDTCPDFDGQIDRAIPWFQPYIPLNSTDYFNVCCADTNCFVPNNYFGIQSARTGFAYAGFAYGYFTGNNTREYLEVELLDSLISGYRYCVTFYVSFAEYSRRACDRIGAVLTTDSLIYFSPPGGCLCTYIPLVERTPGQIISDTSNWVLISDTIVSSGGERFITIGNFYPDSQTTWTTVDSNALHLYAYYYIDDVSVILCDSSVGFNETFNPSHVNVFPSPADAYLFIDLKNKNTNITLRLFDITGQIILQEPFTKQLYIGDFKPGIYFLQISLDSGSVTKKIVKL